MLSLLRRKLVKQPEQGLQPDEPRLAGKRVRWADMHSRESNEVEEEEEQEGEEEEEEEEGEEEEEEENGAGPEDEVEEEEDEDEEITRLRAQISDFDKDLAAKSSLIDRLQLELREAYMESELSKEKLQRLEEDLDNFRTRTLELEQQISKQPDSEEEECLKEKLKESETRIDNLEKELKRILEEKEALEASIMRLQKEGDQELKIVQKAFEGAVAEQDEMISKFEREFEELRTVHANREQQLLEDFEWKLREVEKGCKKRIQDKDKERETHWKEVTDKLFAAEEQLKELPRLKAIETEWDQTKTSNTELKRNLRTTNRRLEEVQVNEKVLQEEANRLRSTLEKEKSYAVNLQIVHREELDERERKLNFKLQVQKNQLTSEWEEKIKRECARVKSDVERVMREEKVLAVDQMKQLKEREIAQHKDIWENKCEQLLKQIEDLKKQILEKDVENRTDLENAQTKSDQEILELRRKMEKLYMSYEEKIEKLHEAHEQQLSKLEDECEKRVQQCESNLVMQVGTTRTTVELVKEQLHRDAELRTHQLEQRHQQALEQQWSRLNKEKEDAVKNVEEKHRNVLKQLQMEMDAMARCIKTKQEKGKQTVDETQKESTISKSKENSDEGIQPNSREEPGEVSQDEQEEMSSSVSQCDLQHFSSQLEASMNEIKELSNLLVDLHQETEALFDKENDETNCQDVIQDDNCVSLEDENDCSLNEEVLLSSDISGDENQQEKQAGPVQEVVQGIRQMCAQAIKMVCPKVTIGSKTDETTKQTAAAIKAVCPKGMNDTKPNEAAKRPPVQPAQGNTSNHPRHRRNRKSRNRRR